MASLRIAVLAGLAASLAWAQDNSGNPPPSNFDKLLRELSDEAPKGATPPEAAPAAPAPAPAMTEEQRNEAITRNYGETVQIYDSILSNQETDAGRIDRRIARLEQMLADYRPKFERNAAIVRSVETQLVLEAKQLKDDMRAGYFDEKAYKAKLKDAEKRAENKMADARDQRDFFAKEIAEAERTLAELKNESKILSRNLEVQRQADIASGKVQPPKPGYLDSILARHKGLGSMSLDHPTRDRDFNLSVIRLLSAGEPQDE